MLQRQDSLLSSSHRQTPPPENRHAAKPIGCMSGFFKLFSKYQNRNKRLTSGRKHVKLTSKEAKARVKLEVEQQQQDSSSVFQEDKKNSDTNGKNLENARLSSCDITAKSPMLPPEIRQSNALTTSEKTTTPKTLLVARLMGLEDDHQLQRQPPGVNMNVRMEQEKSSSSTEEKRRKLLQALEKCNEDLEALKKIIMDVQSDQKKRLKPPSLVLKEDHNLAKTCLKRNAEQLMRRPMSALEEMSRYYHTTKSSSNGIMAHPSKRVSAKKPRENDSINICYLNKFNTATVKEKHRITTPRFWSSKAMIQSVNEVCSDISWGEKRELGNIGMELQNCICRDLIEEVLYDLGFCKMHELPFEVLCANWAKDELIEEIFQNLNFLKTRPCLRTFSKA